MEEWSSAAGVDGSSMNIQDLHMSTGTELVNDSACGSTRFLVGYRPKNHLLSGIVSYSGKEAKEIFSYALRERLDLTVRNDW